MNWRKILAAASIIALACSPVLAQEQVIPMLSNQAPGDSAQGGDSDGTTYIRNRFDFYDSPLLGAGTTFASSGESISGLLTLTVPQPYGTIWASASINNVTAITCPCDLWLFKALPATTITVGGVTTFSAADTANLVAQVHINDCSTSVSTTICQMSGAQSIAHYISATTTPPYTLYADLVGRQASGTASGGVTLHLRYGR
jgi:hypothetical protein